MLAVGPPADAHLQALEAPIADVDVVKPLRVGIQLQFLEAAQQALQGQAHLQLDHVAAKAVMHAAAEAQAALLRVLPVQAEARGLVEHRRVHVCRAQEHEHLVPFFQAGARPLALRGLGYTARVPLQGRVQAQYLLHKVRREARHVSGRRLRRLGLRAEAEDHVGERVSRGHVHHELHKQRQGLGQAQVAALDAFQDAGQGTLLLLCAAQNVVQRQKVPRHEREQLWAPPHARPRLARREEHGDVGAEDLPCALGAQPPKHL
mmetsp:Transcript_10112/g.20731  ORF Transcript_10112/g.20731 Transcript_10112/m.20731 type:complete len:262 (-) Transcript_10112:495-1280(-)